MKGFDYVAPVLTAIGLAAFLAVFAVETRDFRDAVVSWARHDLLERTELAAATLKEPLATSDFRDIHAFGDDCRADGVRLTVYSPGGGVFFDTLHRGETEPESLYETRPCGEFRVRLGLPRDRVLAPFKRARTSLLLAGLVGGAGVLLVFFFTYRQRVRLHELARLEKFRREFIADISHEVKTPLTGILGAADLLGDHVGDGPAANLVGLVKKEAARLDALAQDVLDLARLERAEEALSPAAADPRELAADAVARLKSHADAKGVALTLATDAPADATFRCDARLVERALTNLIGNAIRHSGSPAVSVAVDAQPRTVRFTVEDQGVGIPAEHAPRIFERFHRVDPARAAESGGAGLGLAIVARIARLHGGMIALEPVAPTGCRFILSLPR